MHCVMVNETAVHFVMVRWIAQLTVSRVIQKSVFLTKRSRLAIQLLQGGRPADFGQLMLLFCLKSHHRQMKFLHEYDIVSS